MSQNGKKTFVYLVYGTKPQYYDELKYSVLSILRELQETSPQPEFLLFCDQQVAPDIFPFETCQITAEHLDTWSLGGTYSHAMKLFAAKAALQHCGGKIILVDTDTEFKSDPMVLFDRISDDYALMHDIDGRLDGQGIWDGFLERAPGLGLSEIIHPGATMHNSGLIGVMAGMEPLLDDAINLSQRLYQIDPIFNIEQFALGHSLAQSLDLHHGQDVVRHYWGWMRNVYKHKVPLALEQSGGEISRAAAKQLPYIDIPPKPLISKIQAALVGWRYKMTSAQRFAYLCDLCSRRTANPTDKMIWQDVALQSLQSDPNVSALIKNRFSL